MADRNDGCVQTTAEDAAAPAPASASTCSRADLTECPVIVGTAGHVDHGKSALLEALTGVNPDRLEVERRRGMTVELGFGELALPSGRLVGLVDVPGHAHYLRAMVQGATGVDVALLAVSAVEGVMPQTREHVRVLQLLGVRHLVVALTMCDVADEEMRELAELDVLDFLSDTVFADAPVIPVSARTRMGLDQLLSALDGQIDAYLADAAQRAERPGLTPRLPIDRCFTVHGAGTVVTGTLWDAPVNVGDELEACPSGTRVRVRGIQVHGDTARALPGQRAALNLTGEGAAELQRGEMLAVPGRLGRTLRFAASLTYVGRDGTASAAPLESGARVHVMLGTAEVVGRVMLMEGDGPITAGESGLVQIRLEEPLPARSGDRFIILSYSPVMLIGGGTVLLSRCRRTRDLDSANRALLDVLAAGDRIAAVATWFGMQPLPVGTAELSAALDLTDEESTSALGDLASRDAAVELGSGLYIAPSALEVLMGALEDTLHELHAADKKRTGFTFGEVTHKAFPTASEACARALVDESVRRTICGEEGGELFDPHSATAANRLAAEAAERILSILDGAGCDAPFLPEISEELGVERATMSKALRDLELDRKIVRIDRGFVLSAAAEAAARDAVAATIERYGGAASASDLKDALGVTRKRALPILEHFDAVRFTELDRDAGGVRRLREASQGRTH